MDNLLRRTLTGVFIVIFILGGFWLHPVSFFLTGLVLLAGTQYEYYLLIAGTGTRPQLVPGMATGVTAYLLSTLIAAGYLAEVWFLILIPMFSVMMAIELYRHQQKPFDSLAHTFFSLIYTVVPLSMVPFSAFSHSGLEPLIGKGNLIFSPGIIVGFFLLLWANDTGAYLVGINLGRHRLMERISPKKTWEGFFGGLVIAVLAAWLLSGWLGVVGRIHWIIVSVIVSVAGTFGDLIESMLKRSTGVKDSGTIMPGHGGFLDRFDSTLIAFPIVFLYITLFA